MSNDVQRASSADAGTAIVAALLTLFGVAAINDTYDYADFDSAVFPRTVAILLVILSLAVLLRWLAQRAGFAAAPSSETVDEGGSWLRRIALVVVMLGAGFAMPWTGFLLTALVSFGLLLVIAMHDPWTPARLVVYPLVGIAIVLGFYFLFAKLLMVPLPVGSWFR